MIKTILVPATGNDSDLDVFRGALGTARLFGAHLDFLHVRLEPVAVATALAGVDGGAGVLASGWLDQLAADAEQRATRAREACERFCAAEGIKLGTAAGETGAITAKINLETGSEPNATVAHAQTADLVVIGRPAAGTGSVSGTLDAVLFNSGRPILIPAGATLPAPLPIVAIAWKPTREAARAVTAAMPFIAKAARIVIVTIASEDDPADRASAERLAAALRRQGGTVEIRAETESGGGPETLLRTVQGSADLLVMGGYGHNRFREMAFGGFTAEVLSRADIPVVMAH